MAAFMICAVEGKGLPMTTRFSRLECVGLAAVACYAVAVLPSSPKALSYIAGTILCFLLTGVAISDALFPGRIGGLERVTAVIASTLAAGVVGGLVINLLPSGFTQKNWLTYALATTLVAYVVARLRRGTEPVHWGRPKTPIQGWPAWAKIATSVLMLTAAAVISITSTSWTEKPFTELWLVPDNPDQSPLHATTAIVGIKSHESSVEDFTVVIDTGKEILKSQLSLAPDQVWTQAVPVDGEKVVASIYRPNATDKPYRTVFLDTE
jgi:uncharacterized membrane protein